MTAKADCTREVHKAREGTFFSLWKKLVTCTAPPSDMGYLRLLGALFGRRLDQDWYVHFPLTMEEVDCDVYREFIVQSWNPSAPKIIEGVLQETLTSREFKILCSRFALLGEEQKTLKQIAEQEGVTSPRVRQIEQKALRRLRSSPRTRDLKKFLLNFGELIERNTILEAEVDALRCENAMLYKANAECMVAPLQKPPILLESPLSALGLSPRTYMCLRAEKISTIGQLVEWNWDDLLKIPSVGLQTMVEITDVLAKHGLMLQGHNTKHDL